MKHIFFLLCLVCQLGIAVAQKNYQPGIIIRLNGTMEKGLIDNKEWSTNPKKISFRWTMNETPVELGIGDISSFSINGSSRYFRAVVVKDMRPVAIEDLNSFPEDSVATDTTFLKELFHNDTISLYMLHDFKDHFYVKESGGDYVELKYGLRYDRASSSYSKNNAFQNQLLNFFPDKKEDAQIVSYLEGLKYDEKDIAGFFYKVTQTSQKLEKKTRPVFFVGTGAQFSKFKVNGNTPIADESYNNSITPLFFAGVDFGSSKNLSDFVIRVQAEYNSFDYKGNYTRTSFPNTVEDESYVLKVSNIRLSAAVLYNFWRNASSKSYVGVETFFNSSSYKENAFTRVNTATNAVTFIDDYYSYEKSWIGINGNAGFIFKNKFDLSANFKLFGSFSRMVGIGISPNIFALKLAYRF